MHNHNYIKVKLPYSEVCCHMRVAGTVMFVEPLDRNMAQLWTLDFKRFSIPITNGEAGLPYVPRRDKVGSPWPCHYMLPFEEVNAS